MNHITLTAQASPTGWYKTIQSVNLPYSHLIEFSVTAWGWAAVVRLLDNDDYWLVGIDTSGHPFVSIKTGATWTVGCSLPDVVPAEATVQIAFREVRLGATTSDVYHTVSMFLNDRHRISYTEFHASIAGSVRFGLAVYSGLTRKFSNVRIPELAAYADWASIDPGETGDSGLRRTIEGYYIKTILKHNGTMRAWVPKTSPSVHNYTTEEADSIEEVVDTRALKTHVRLIGAYAQAEYVDTDLMRQHGHRFMEINNPYLFTEQECYEQAQLAIRRMREQAVVNTLSVLYQPLVEPEDHITTPYGERIVTSRSIVFGGAGDISESMTARQYTYE
jgi:hypothetical protein